MSSREVCIHNMEIKDDGSCSCTVCYPPGPSEFEVLQEKVDRLLLDNECLRAACRELSARVPAEEDCQHCGLPMTENEAVLNFGICERCFIDPRIADMEAIIKILAANIVGAPIHPTPNCNFIEAQDNTIQRLKELAKTGVKDGE